MGVDWVGATAAKIAAAGGRGDTTATRVVADHLDQARLANHLVAAVRTGRAAAAIAEAELVDQQPDPAALPLAGVPVLVGQDTPVAGLPAFRPALSGAAATLAGTGCEVLSGTDSEILSGTDHESVRRLRGGGAVILGAARVAELGLWATTDDVGAITRNPWGPEFSAGGAAGGAAAAVAAGIVPVAYAIDGLGSLRIPAACCGVIGLKPDRDLIWFGPDDWLGLAQHGVLATTAVDALLGFSVLAGHPVVRWPEPGRLRIAVSTRSPMPGVAADVDTRAAVAQAARSLVRAGYDAVAADPPYPARLSVTVAATWSAVAHRLARAHDAVGGHDGLSGRDGLQPRTRRQASLGARVVGRQLVRDGARSDWRDRCRDWLADCGFDALLLPALPGPVPAARYWSERGWRSNVSIALRLSAFTAPGNLAGLPAITVPVGRRSDGLPGCVQFVAAPGGEGQLLALAALLERLAPWRRLAPGWPRDPDVLLREATAAYPLLGARP
jgi:amidase